MNKKSSLILAFLITLALTFNYLFFNYNQKPNREIVKIARVLDGDTVVLEDGRTIRVLNINSPEKGRPYSDLSNDFLNNFLNESIELDSEGKGIYGRTLARLYSLDGLYLNLEIVRLGFAHKYLVIDSESKEFIDAQGYAISNGLGIWERSEWFGCLDILIDELSEFVEITNNCNVSIENWTLKDESTRIYKFKNVKSSQFTLFSDEGIDNDEEIYWNKGNVWNNDGDSIFIRDSSGLLVYHDEY